MKAIGAVAAALGLALATPGAAQEGDDWDFARDEARDLTSASVEYASGAGLFVQCHAGTLIVALAGTPLSSGEPRSAVVERQGEEPVDYPWTATPDGRMATASWRRLARLLYRGGPVVLSSTADDDHAFQVAFDLPVHGPALAQVLSACGTPLTDDRDLLASAEQYLEEIPIVWRPNRDLPGRHDNQTVEISCIVRQARLTACRSDLEVPANPQAGEAVAEAAEGVAVQLSDPAAAEGGVVDIIITGTRYRRKT